MKPAVDEGRSVVVIDDDELFRELISAVLARAGYAVRDVATGEEGLEAVRLRPPSLVVIDVRLVGMSGYDVCRVLRRDYGDSLPIVFVSGERTESFDRVAGLRLGGDDYIVKPLDPDELLARVDRLVGHARSRISAPAILKLTRREVDVLELLVAGLRSKEIAHELSISIKTAATHIQNILTKLEVHSQAQAIAAALSSGFVTNGNGRSTEASAIWGEARDVHSSGRRPARDRSAAVKKTTRPPTGDAIKSGSTRIESPATGGAPC